VGVRIRSREASRDRRTHAVPSSPAARQQKRDAGQDPTWKRINNTPARVPLANVTLAVGALRHSLYDSSGEVLSCGAGPVGQLGDGTGGRLARTGTPVPVLGLPGGHAVALTSGWATRVC
jgi:hypothetical protein